MIPASSTSGPGLGPHHHYEEEPRSNVNNESSHEREALDEARGGASRSSSLSAEPTPGPRSRDAGSRGHSKDDIGRNLLLQTDAIKQHYGSLDFLQVLGSNPNQGPMLFLLGGAALACLLVTWARGSSLRITNPYSFSVTFSQALGIEAGVPLRLKGVPVGAVKDVKSSLQCVEAVIEVHQKSTRIPRDSKLVFNKAGALTPAAFIDVKLPKGAASSGAVADHNADDMVAMQDAVATAGTSRSPVDDDDDDDDASSATSRVSSGSTGVLDEIMRSSSSVMLSSSSSSSAVAEAVSAVSGPDDVDACRAEGALICRGDVVRGVQGGGMDEFSALMLKSMVRGAEQWQLPPGLRGRQQ